MKSSEHVWQNEKRSVLTNPKKVKRPTRQKIHFGWVEEERARKKVLEMRKQSQSKWLWKHPCKFRGVPHTQN